MLIVDGHQDLAWNMLTFGRDYTRSAAATRQSEAGGETPEHNDDSVLGWPDYQRGQVGVILATLYVTPQRCRTGAYDTHCYADYNQAHRLYSAQLDAYERLVNDHSDKFRLVLEQKDLQAVLDAWRQAPPNSPVSPENHPLAEPEHGLPVGLVVLMEGAEGVREPDELEYWRQRGVRLIGPAWAGTRFCGGTHEPGPLTSEGFALLAGMADFNFILDLTHMDEAAVLQALDYYPAQVLASHSNALSLLKGSSGDHSNRHLSDRVVQGILARDGLIGVVTYNGFLKAGWKKGDPRQDVTLENIVAQIDYICQMAGDAQHVGIGSDMDGGFGLQSLPAGLDTIADLQKLVPLLSEKGYSMQDIAAIFSENWLKRIEKALP